MVFSRSCLDVPQEVHQELNASIKELRVDGFELYCTSHDEDNASVIEEAGLEGCVWNRFSRASRGLLLIAY